MIWPIYKTPKYEFKLGLPKGNGPGYSQTFLEDKKEQIKFPSAAEDQERCSLFFRVSFMFSFLFPSRLHKIRHFLWPFKTLNPVYAEEAKFWTLIPNLKDKYYSAFPSDHQYLSCFSNMGFHEISLHSLLMCQYLFQISALLQRGTVLQMRQ